MKIYHKTISLQTPREDLIDITAQVLHILRESGIQEGHCIVYCPHTTAGITVNENADPDVVHDLLFALNKTYPKHPQFRHMEDNSNAHCKSTVVGCQQTLIIKQGKLLLGRWQGIYFCEFDGPRSRTVEISIQGNL